MPIYCDVALPVPVDSLFTYTVEGPAPELGARVLVSFRHEQMLGVVVRLHQEWPQAQTTQLKPILRIVDVEPVLAPDLLELGQWIAQYYLAPLGEVLRAMLPLQAELRQRTRYCITEAGLRAHNTAQATLLPQLPLEAAAEPARLQAEQALLTRLAEGQMHSAASLLRKSAATTATLNALLRKGWIARASSAETRSVRRTVSIAVLVDDLRLPKLNANQQLLLAALAGAQGRLPVPSLALLPVPKTTLTTLVRKGLVRIEEVPADSPFAQSAAVRAGLSTAHTLNPAQADAVEQISARVQAGGFAPFLLHGITGSGKTAVYLAAMRRTLDAGRGSLLLVPEIGLTPAMVAQMQAAFGDQVALLHSALTQTERVEQWRRIHSGEARVVVGTRSAVFAPVQDLALVIVDEEHDTSYKQAEMPRYHARDVAVVRARLQQAAVVLGSATPSLESWLNVDRKKYSLLSLPQRVADRPLPEVTLIDMRQEFRETGSEQLLSRALHAAMEETLARKEQVMLLLNRRGYSYVVLCRACGVKLECENCAIALTHHKSLDGSGALSAAGQRMECHYCGFCRTVPKRCPACDSEHLYAFGVGSQQGEERLQAMFPGANIARMDRDTMRSHKDFERVLAQLHRGEIDILVGTQMIAKGHDMHGVTLVGVLGADHALGLPDFRAAERVFQLITQVAGRAGRGERSGRVLVQTYYPDHYAMQHAAAQNYTAFAEHELRYRRLLHYPPAAVLTNILLEHADEQKAAGWAKQLGRWLEQHPHPHVRVLGPAAAPIARIKRIHRFHLILKSSSRKELAQLVRSLLEFAEGAGIARRNLTVDVDALHLM
jgi:primosomal protein N' (replication factor Y)